MEEPQLEFSHYAILIGINAYPEKPLESCVRDVKNIEKYLKRMSNPVHLHMLTATESSDSSRPAEDPNLWPTYANVISNLEKLTSLAKAGDFVYIHFSGHGTTREPFKDPSNLSIEGLAPNLSKFSNPSTGDLALAVLEVTTNTEIRYLHGEDLANLIERMVNKGLVITLVLDCCFSGSVMRHNSSVRHLPYDPKVDAAYLPAFGLSAEGKASLTIDRNLSLRSNWLVDPKGYTILAACGPAEIAEEIVCNGQKCGALS